MNNELLISILALIPEHETAEKVETIFNHIKENPRNNNDLLKMTTIADFSPEDWSFINKRALRAEAQHQEQGNGNRSEAYINSITADLKHIFNYDF